MKIFYHHIPRTGGTSIGKIAEKNYKNNFFIWQNYVNANEVLKRFKNEKDFFILCDSLFFTDDVKKILEICDLDIISIRDPISRFESLYNIWMDTNFYDSPYNISSEHLSIDDFYLKCKKENKNLFLNLQHQYIKTYSPKQVVKTENLSEYIKNLKDIGVFPNLIEEDLTVSNKSKSNFSLSENIKEDYKLYFPEDFYLLY